MRDILAAYYGQRARSVLPPGYRRVARLISTGTQYIDTGIAWGAHDWEAEFTRLGDFRLGVVHQGVANGTWNALTASAYRYRAYTDLVSFSSALGDVFRVSCADGLYVAGRRVTAQTFADSTDSTAAVPLCLFLFFDLAIGAVETRASASLPLAEFSLRTTGGAALRDYVPCVRVADGKPGMYDLCGSVCPLTNTPFYISARGGADFSYTED